MTLKMTSLQLHHPLHSEVKRFICSENCQSLTKKLLYGKISLFQGSMKQTGFWFIYLFIFWLLLLIMNVFF